MPRSTAARKRTAPTLSIIDVMEHKELLASFFEPQESWERWKIALSAAFGLPPPKGCSIDPVEFYREHTGRSEWPTEPAKEIWNVIGVRGGKSRIAALIAFVLAVFRDYSKFLAPGEYGTLPVIAADRKQARTVFGYIRAFFDEPMFAPLVRSETQESITLTSRIRIEVHTASFKSVRGYTCVGCVADEIAVWSADGSNPDAEIITAIRSRFATIPGALLVAISSPYARSGELWATYDRHFGNKGSPDMFVWQAASRDMNPSIPEAHIAREYERDPARAAAEYGGEFRTDVERFVPIEIVQACVPETGRIQNPPEANVTYRAFVDPSGGRADAMVLAIGHRGSTGSVVLDAMMAVQPPFEPTSAISQMVTLCRIFRVGRVHGDRYGGEWPREGFRKEGVEYVLHPRAKSDLYVDMLPHLTSRTVELLDHPKLAIELTSLERRVSPSGRELIDHPKHGHDDHANAVAGLIDLLAKGGSLMPVWGRRLARGSG